MVDRKRHFSTARARPVAQRPVPGHSQEPPRLHLGACIGHALHVDVEPGVRARARAVGERGVRLSGGQTQRVAIARALLAAPRLLLFDEATSALDAESEALVQDAIDALCVGRTSISVAHRLSTVVNADLIALVQGGRVIGSGRHDALLRDCAEYANLVRRQLRAADSSASLAS